jgi:threonine dehydrogenase-like Zn-dependent dehydrogenase
MRAVVVQPERERSARVLEVPLPSRAAGECLVRMLEVGIDGTDREIDAGKYGETPPGEPHLILGHESLGELRECAADAAGLAPGDLVVATVRRPCPELCPNCRNWEFDFCSTAHFTERGIKQRHGFLCEWFTERPEYLVRVPRELHPVAVLLEPLSVVEKAFRQAALLQRRLLWQPHRVLVTGAGSIGLLAALIARLRGFETVLYSRGAPQGAEAVIVSSLALPYVDSESRELGEVARDYGSPDLVIEATGFSPFAWEVADILALNGVACLLSVTAGRRRARIPSDRLNTELVLGNRLIFGSVNAHRCDFERGIEDLALACARWPGVLERMLTRRLPLQRIREALDDDPAGDIKTVVEIAPPASE